MREMPISLDEKQRIPDINMPKSAFERDPRR